MPEIKQNQDFRREFIDTICELAGKDKNVCLIIPDVGFNYCEKFEERFPDQFLNTGVTEAFTTIFATTLALDGWKPYLYSMINFVLFRPYEMVRNGIVNHKANVKLLGVKGSSSYRFLGFSHNLRHDSEDFNVCHNMGLQWENPKTNEDVRKVILESYKKETPLYVRL